jgi:hypothetical protein
MCGSSKDLTDEHVISKTVRRQVPGVKLVWRTYRGRRSRALQALHVVLKDAVCRTCNGGWMKELEDDFVALLGPQIRAEGGLALNPAASERAATWAVKTGLLLEIHHSGLGDSDTFAPTNNLRWLADHRSPPPGAEVWIGQYDFRGEHNVHWSQPLSLGADVGRDGLPVRVAYTSPFTIGALAFYVFGRDLLLGTNAGDFASLDPPNWFGEVFVKLWPRAGDLAFWPPPKHIALDALPGLQSWIATRLDPLPPETQ